ncbi:3-oxoacyl-[acyl-carrier-protein] reductase [Geodia barretti]|uniref:3-oxoacyl-[acyl-carrier-protein] reductase n=1 Tax=Geodia barretti TaxID=519541 RepID=A0AA35RK09_GEOBA|nr:3-oxoacyl-[acyl-carrier-protein] reductase [Geodia barretti]
MGGIAEELAREGANLVCVDVREEYAEKCAAAIVTEGRDAIGVACDVTDEDQVLAAVSRATERFGGVDILVNGAAQFNFKGVLNMPVDEWRRQTDIILTGAFLFTKHVAHLMIQQERKGNIINIISTAGHQGEPGNVGYGTAKAGLINFTRSVAMELARYGIRVNSLTPTATGQSEGLERAARWACGGLAGAPTGTTRFGTAAGRQPGRTAAQAAQPVALRQGCGLSGIRRC